MRRTRVRGKFVGSLQIAKKKVGAFPECVGTVGSEFPEHRLGLLEIVELGVGDFELLEKALETISTDRFKISLSCRFIKVDGPGRIGADRRAINGRDSGVILGREGGRFTNSAIAIDTSKLDHLVGVDNAGKIWFEEILLDEVVV